MVQTRKQKRLKKALIIKLGYSETLDRTLTLNSSLGDVLRTTFILYYFKDYEVTWLVDERAAPLIEDNKYVKHVLVYNPSTLISIKKERFETIVNFEKSPEICKMSDSIASVRRFGFRFRKTRDRTSKKGYLGGDKKLVALSQSTGKRNKNARCWQEILAEAVDEKWQGEPYMLGYRPKSKVKHDVGFNWTASNKWENKAWPKMHWKKLEDLTKDQYSVSWQQGLGNLYDYMEWINSCRLIVTADTLGLHLSLALKKRVIALFGPTSPREIYFYNIGSFLLPEPPYSCMPCFRFTCNKPRQCMEYIFPEKVKKRIDDEFKKIVSSA